MVRKRRAKMQSSYLSLFLRNWKRDLAYLSRETGSGIKFPRTTSTSRTGVGSYQQSQLNSGDVAYATKRFTIRNMTIALIRVWMRIEADSQTEIILEIITDAGGVSQTRSLAIPFDWNPKGGTEVCDQWVVAALKMPVNGTYEVRWRIRVESMNLNQPVNWDDIRVVES
jgi:hypothetical protein